MARVHSKAAVSAGAHLAVIASSTKTRALLVGAALGYERASADPYDLIADPTVDVVHICSPNGTHAPYARAALAAGKHVVCEKPLATSAADAHQLAQLAEESGLVAVVPFVYRFHPMVREARERAVNGEMGSLLSFHGVYLQDWLLDSLDDNWRVDAVLGGPSRAFADIGSHLVDLLEFVSGEQIQRIASRSRTVHGARASHTDIVTEDAVVAVAETTSGAIGTLLVSQVAPGRKNHLAIELAGESASLRFEQEQPDELWLGRRSGSTLLLRDPNQIGTQAQRLNSLPPGHPLGYQDAFSAFVADAYAAVKGAREDGLPEFSDGARAAVLTEAVIEANRSGEWVDIATIQAGVCGDALPERTKA